MNPGRGSRCLSVLAGLVLALLPASSRGEESPATERAASLAAEKPPGEVVVDENEAQRALERSLTRTGALLLPPGVVEIQPGVAYVRNENAFPTFVDASEATLPGEREQNLDLVVTDASIRVGLPREFQAEAGVSYRWARIENVTRVELSPVDSSSRSAAGVGDIRMGLAKTLLREDSNGLDLVGRFRWDTATGRTSENGVPLGGGFHEIGGGLTALKRQAPIVFVGSVSYDHSFESDARRPGATFSSSVGGFIAFSPETSLRFVVSGAHQGETEISGSSVAGSDRVVGSLVIGASTLLDAAALLDLAVGIGVTSDAADLSFTVSVPFQTDVF